MTQLCGGHRGSTFAQRAQESSVPITSGLSFLRVTILDPPAIVPIRFPRKQRVKFDVNNVMGGLEHIKEEDLQTLAAKCAYASNPGRLMDHERGNWEDVHEGVRLHQRLNQDPWGGGQVHLTRF